MAALTDDSVLDAALDDLATCNAVHICSAEPANFAGIAAVSLGEYALTAGDGNGDWTIADGDTSGRKCTMSAQTGTNASATGTGTDLAFEDGTTMKHRADLASSLGVTSGQEFQLSALDVLELRDSVNE